MKAILLIAHGSRREQSNSEVAQLTEKLKRKCPTNVQIVQHAFLELATPTIQEGIKICVDEGATSILVLPFFLNSGQHVHHDIPNRLNEASTLYSNVTINVASHLGASDDIVDILIGSIASM